MDAIYNSCRGCRMSAVKLADQIINAYSKNIQSKGFPC